jgi:hypothetical protein
MTDDPFNPTTESVLATTDPSWSESSDSMPDDLLDQPIRFSQSRLWNMQRAFFEDHGVDAWRREIVPHYVTSNPFMARSCARQVLGVFRDLVTRGIDTTQPLYIVELGAGCGRFAYHFLTSFLELHAPSALADVRFCYVMTDHAEKTLEFWRSHEQLGEIIRVRFGIPHDPLFNLTDSALHVGVAIEAFAASLHQIRCAVRVT